jgi:hypothetical protein
MCVVIECSQEERWTFIKPRSSTARMSYAT